MSRRDRQRLEDVLAATEAIDAHLQRGDLSDGLVFEADLPELESGTRRLLQRAEDS